MEEFGQHYTTLNHDNNERRLSSCDQFIVEDLLDFSHEDAQDVANNISPFDDHHQNYASGSSRTSNSNNSDSSTVVTPVDSCNSSFSGGNNDPLFPPPAYIGSHISAELGVPYHDLAQLEWLSNFVEESFSSEDLHKFHQIPNISAAMKARPNESFQARYNPSEPTQFISTPTSPVLNREVAVPGKARSKRSRAAPCNWASRLLVVSPGAEGTDHETINKPTKPIGSKKKVLGSSIVGPTMDLTNGGEVRKCLHCATDKTPQWRSGPMGPKTLCNACGVRYKSGRLVPEYRPAASPTFMLTKHSNSHRKVMELRRQKDLMRQQQLQPQQQYHQLHHNPINNSNKTMMFDSSNGDDYLIHQQIGPDFRQLIELNDLTC